MGEKKLCLRMDTMYGKLCSKLRGHESGCLFELPTMVGIPEIPLEDCIKCDTLRSQLQKAQEWREKAEKVIEAARVYEKAADDITVDEFEVEMDKINAYTDAHHNLMMALSALETGKEKAP